MLLTDYSDIDKYQMLYENIYPAVIAAVVTLLGVFVQLYVGVSGNNLVLKSISKTKKIESYMQFYRPLSMLLNEIIIFFENHTEFDFCEEQYHDVNYYKELEELQNIYSKICNWYSNNYINMYPEDKELDKSLSEIYNHMRSILPVVEANPSSWNVLSKYKRDDITSIIYTINSKIDKIIYKYI